jgi:hypothetical protein
MEILIPTIKESTSWGPDDPCVERVWALTKDTLRHVPVEVRDTANFAADRLYDKLVTARNSYQIIASSNFAELNVGQQNSAYDNFYSAIWTAYKDRFQVLMKTLGYDIGFMFVNDQNYDKKAKDFVEDHPSLAWLPDYGKTLRENWQNDLARTRTALQHNGDLRGLPDLNEPGIARAIIEVVCYAIEGQFALLASESLQYPWRMALVNDDMTVFERGDRFALRAIP